MKSEFAESADVTIGVSVKLPYENSIHSEELFDQLTVIDANNDKSTWTFDSGYEQPLISTTQKTRATTGSYRLL